jgi:transposase
MKNKMIKRSHLSEKKCREIIQLFAEDLTATQIANITGVSRVTINNYLKLIRTQVARYCEERNPFYFSANGTILPLGPTSYKKMDPNGMDATAESLHTLYGFFRQGGNIFVDGLHQANKNDVLSLQKARWNGLTNSTIKEELLKYQAIADFDSWHLYRMDTTHIVNGRSVVDDISVFWGHAKNRLMKFRGLNKNTLYLHVKECEFRYNYRSSEINTMLLSIMYHHPLYLTEAHLPKKAG